jgi:hypothetical protein
MFDGPVGGPVPTCCGVPRGSDVEGRGCYPCQRESIGFRPEPVARGVKAMPYRSMVDFFLSRRRQQQQERQLDQVPPPAELQRAHELQGGMPLCTFLVYRWRDEIINIDKITHIKKFERKKEYNKNGKLIIEKRNQMQKKWNKNIIYKFILIQKYKNSH